MGRSQATFGKKENEKKRQKKKLDKAERKEERQANAAKQAEEIEFALAFHLAQGLVVGEILDADNDPRAQPAESVGQTPEGILGETWHS